MRRKIKVNKVTISSSGIGKCRFFLLLHHVQNVQDELQMKRLSQTRDV